MPLQLYDMDSTAVKLQVGKCDVFDDKFILACNLVIILLTIPVLNSIVYPFLREYMPNMLKRIGFGAVLALLAQISTLVISGAGSRRHWEGVDSQCMFSYANFSNTVAIQNKDYIYSSVPEAYTVIPLVLISFAEIFIHITSMIVTSSITEILLNLFLSLSKF